MPHKMVIRFPWRPGPHAADGPVWITASRLTFRSFPALVIAAPYALKFWANWTDMPGAVGLSMHVEPLRRSSWTVSVWAAPTGTDDFVQSPAHQRIMRGFGHVVEGTSTSWMSESLDVQAAWRHAIAELEPV